MFPPFPPQSAHAATRPPRARYLSVPQLVIVVGVALLALLALSGPLRAANTGGTEQTDPYNPVMNAYVGQYDTASYVGIDGGYTGNVYGGQSTGNFVQANTVILTTGTVTGTVYGGSSWSDEAKQNIVTLYGAQVGEYIFGGHVLAGTSAASYNTVNINGGTVESVYGGASASGSALDNTVTINGLGSAWSPNGAVVNYDVYGGFVGNAADASITASRNTVTMSGGTVTGSIYGGRVDSGAGRATENTVTIYGGTVGNVFGGSTSSGRATENIVNILGYVETSDISGGVVSSGSGDASSNSVTMVLGTADNMYGGFVAFGTGYAAGNNATMTGGTVRKIYGARTNTGDASANNVNISEGTGNTTQVSNGAYGGYVGSGSGYASRNTVSISGGAVNGVYGGYVGGTGNAVSNTVDISGGTVGNVYGGLANDGGTATGNTVIIRGDSTVVTDNVTGGKAANGGSATGNTVEISGGTVNGDVYGGLSGMGSGGSVTDNTVRIKGAPTFGSTTILRGGYSYAGPSGTDDVRTGNTLETWTKDISVYKLENFQNLHFYLPSTIAANDTVLTVTDDSGVDIRTPTGKPATTVGVGIVGGGTPLSAGDTVTLIKATGAGGLTADPTIANTTTGMQGISTVYAFALGVTGGNALEATVSSASDSHEGVRKSPSEGQAAGAAALTQGGDLAGGQGMTSARQTARVASAGGAAQGGWGGFGATSGGMSTYATGSHVDARGVSIMLGLAKRFGLDGADLVAGPFFEAGVGSYDSYNDGPGGDDSIHAWGDSNYQGGGLLARLEATQGMLKGLYAEASARAGSLHTTYRSDDLNPALGRASYQTTSGYVGAHGGLGYVWDMDERTDLDMYGKYFWTRTEGSSATVLGDELDFDAVDSQRLRAGARLSRDLTANVRPYVGAAWDHEFAGSARSTVNGQGVAAPSLAGDTGVGELGLEWKPVEDGGFSVDLGAQGYVGMRQGWSGSLQLKYEF
ncbi:autotransporter outer membrane beta-barrel domain-containing protein [Nitratidesulfovibrio sp. SRB-5]|uniref:autotransporter outer membrane beta-barrel domain-containing protein n=1 Tax=Nitratidesulfovibrio sp. SRB-5 TaxID=2872636 RepID=UPI0010279BA1|nr:autotransporter outer membrane beta-barrel domain-containing protein [Nitratidesulfovibrio sp. SRB-5]MBZ2171955.1 autotransporter outer membrane beta-barrel domain-containing protein [Nitratidesulfovibrio sp. SRB-5]RXF78564.1 autotransporter outer membrane beta-barrel domain-containing protein [Desulfovibrio sp. DS-1]